MPAPSPYFAMTTDLKPIGREAALDGAEHQLAVLEFAIEECGKIVGKARKGDEDALRKSAYMLWAMHLIPLAAHRMLQDYCTGELVDKRPDMDDDGAPVESESDTETAEDKAPLFEGESGDAAP